MGFEIDLIRYVARENERIMEWLPQLNFWIKQHDVFRMQSEGKNRPYVKDSISFLIIQELLITNFLDQSFVDYLTQKFGNANHAVARIYLTIRKGLILPRA